MTSDRSDSRTMARVRSGEPEVEHFRAMAELSTDFIGMATADGVPVYVNPAGRQMCGIEPDADLSQMTLAAFHPSGEIIDRLREGCRTALDHGTWRGETVLLARDGSAIPGHQLIVAHDPRPGEKPLLSTVIRDNRALFELESKLAHAQRLESIGRLAGGVAHDFNNLLTVIGNYVELVREDLAADCTGRRDLDVALEATSRAATLCRQLLSFAKKDVIRPESTDLNEVLTGFASLAGRIAGEHIRLELDLDRAPCPVTVDPGQLDQILANLIVNAREAMLDGGLLTLSTRQPPLRDIPPSLPKGAYVELGVSDTGMGMSADVREKIFEPFFTTKRGGHGSGLGLSTVYGAVTQNRGHIYVDSAPDQGTRVRILWPLSAQTAVQRPTAPASSVTLGHECVLVVEDEEMVRVLSARALRAAGYRVLEAASPVEALEVAERHREELDLLLSDVVMPDMNGRVLSERIRQFLPRLPVLFMSGYTDSVLDEGGALGPNVSLLTKPFNRAQLLTKVREVLGAEVKAAAPEAARSY